MDAMTAIISGLTFGVEQPVADVDNQIDGYDEDGDHHHHSLQDRRVATVDGIEDQRAEAGDRETPSRSRRTR